MICPVSCWHYHTGLALTEGARRATEVSAKNRRHPSRWGLGCWIEGHTLRGVTAYDMRSVGEAQRAIQVFAHRDPTARQRAPPTSPLDLQHPIPRTHRVVPIHHPLLLEGKDTIQIASLHPQKGMPRLGRPHREAPVEVGHV